MLKLVLSESKQEQGQPSWLAGPTCKTAFLGTAVFNKIYELGMILIARVPSGRGRSLTIEILAKQKGRIGSEFFGLEVEALEAKFQEVKEMR